jgi:hypothetical protein
MKRVLVIAMAFFWGIWGVTVSAQSSSTSSSASINQMTMSQPESPVSEAPTWKATISSTYFDLEGTKFANNNAYGFGSVNVYQQLFIVDHDLGSDWKATLRAEYIKNDYVLLFGGTSQAWDTSGLGDTFLGVSHPLYKTEDYLLKAEGGFFLPTGSANASNPYSGGRYVYFMQIGSGTFDPTLNVTSVYAKKYFQWVTRVSDTERIGKNAEDYALGHVYRGDMNFLVPVAFGFKAEALGYYRLRGSIQGGDPEFTLAGTQYYHHDQIDWMTGVGVKYSTPLVSQVALNAEVVVPVQQGLINYDNVVISTNYYANLNLTGSF